MEFVKKPLVALLIGMFFGILTAFGGRWLVKRLSKPEKRREALEKELAELKKAA